MLVGGQLMYPFVSGHYSTYFTVVCLVMIVDKHGFPRLKTTWKFYPLELRIYVTPHL